MGEIEELQEPRFETLATKPPNTSQVWLFLPDFILQTGTLRGVGRMAPICTFSAY